MAGEFSSTRSSELSARLDCNENLWILQDGRTDILVLPILQFSVTSWKTLVTNKVLAINDTEPKADSAGARKDIQERHCPFERKKIRMTTEAHFSVKHGQWHCYLLQDARQSHSRMRLIQAAENITEGMLEKASKRDEWPLQTNLLSFWLHEELCSRINMIRGTREHTDQKYNSQNSCAMKSLGTRKLITSGPTFWNSHTRNQLESPLCGIRRSNPEERMFQVTFLQHKNSTTEPAFPNEVNHIIPLYNYGYTERKCHDQHVFVSSGC